MEEMVENLMLKASNRQHAGTIQALWNQWRPTTSFILLYLVEFCFPIKYILRHVFVEEQYNDCRRESLATNCGILWRF